MALVPLPSALVTTPVITTLRRVLRRSRTRSGRWALRATIEPDESEAAIQQREQ
jgi:hypothetical protein